MISYNLPKDAMMEILARLPAKSLMRFKCVCKSWCDLVEDSDFIGKHYETRASIIQNNSILVTRYSLLEDEEYIMFSLLYEEPPKGIQCLDLDGPFESNSREIYGHRGVFCVAYCDEREIRHAYFSNHDTREYKSLPTTDDPEAPPNACVWKCHLALGFDHKTSDYKVVRVWTSRHFPRDDVPEYYSHGRGVQSSASKSWRHINTVPPDILLSESECHIYLKGKYYWKSRINPPPYRLISFDFGTEAFQTLLLPNAPLGSDYWAHILVLNNTLALISFPIPTNKNRVEIWLMNEDGENVSWAKYITLDTEYCKHWEALASWKNDHLFVHGDEGKFLSFSLSSSHEPRQQRS